ncbi:DUF421 domain-containing protein [Pontibacter diazotrophicus]|nr:YetF domain-containing protein [Pontibacter diazotrophicus]
MRIILGDVPWSFLIEVIIRITFIYLLLMVSMRFMGKRMASTLSNSELAALVSLAAAVGVPMLAPERGMLPALIIAVIVVSIQRIISYYSYKSSKFEFLALGDISVLVKDGRMLLDVMKLNRVSPERLLAELRSAGITNLGKVRRSYFEATGEFTNYLYENPIPGLNILPEWDESFRSEQQETVDTFACRNCGNTVENERDREWNCSNCGEKDWTNAIVS